eukprot:5952422-Pyramimonas_sp.AAC.1
MASSSRTNGDTSAAWDGGQSTVYHRPNQRHGRVVLVELSERVLGSLRSLPSVAILAQVRNLAKRPRA